MAQDTTSIHALMLTGSPSNSLNHKFQTFYLKVAARVGGEAWQTSSGKDEEEKTIKMEKIKPLDS